MRHSAFKSTIMSIILDNVVEISCRSKKKCSSFHSTVPLRRSRERERERERERTEKSTEDSTEHSAVDSTHHRAHSTCLLRHINLFYIVQTQQNETEEIKLFPLELKLSWEKKSEVLGPTVDTLLAPILRTFDLEEEQMIKRCVNALIAM